MICDVCEELDLVWPIRSPRELRKAVRVALDNLGDGTLEEVGNGPSLLEEAPKLLNPTEPWPDDILEYRFACTECGATYMLSCETYHGSGGDWAPVDAD